MLAAVLDPTLLELVPIVQQCPQYGITSVHSGSMLICTVYES